MAHAIHLVDGDLRPGLSLFARLVASFAAWRTYLETLAELERMTDRELLDINLSRADLRDVARQAAWGR